MNGSPGDLADLEGAHDPTPVGRQDVGGCTRIPLGQDAVEPGGAKRLQPGLPARPDLWVAAREAEIIEEGAHIEPGPTHDDRGHAPGPQRPEDRAAVVLVLRDADLLGDIEDVQEVVRDPLALAQGELGGADVHAAIDLERVRIDHLATEASGDFDANVGLAHCGRTDDGHDRGPPQWLHHVSRRVAGRACPG